MYLFKVLRKQTLGIINIINLMFVFLLLTLNNYQHLFLVLWNLLLYTKTLH